MGLLTQSSEAYYEGADGNWNSGDENYGDYQFASLKDMINNFMVAYVGEDKIISKIKRTDVAFFAQRAIQELSFDTLPSEKSLEIEIPPSLSFILPQDYVNYVKLSWTDQQGMERIIYPTRNTSNPNAAAQDDDYEYAFSQAGELLLAHESETLKRFRKDSSNNATEANANNLTAGQLFNLYRYGRRYGLQPEQAQGNGVYYIDNNIGIIHFSSNLINKIITLKYISDGLSGEDIRVHKFAEEAIYKYVAYSILGTRANTPEYQVQRFKKEFFVAKRTAKLRLSNLKLAELAQVMRNQSKWIK